MLAASTQFLVDLFLLLGCAVLAGEIASHLGQPALVGQLLVGVALGPTLLGGYIGLTSLSIGTSGIELSGIQFLATVFVLFMAGLEVVPEKLYRVGLPTIAFGLAVFFVPFVVAGLTVPLFVPGLGLSTSLLVAVTLSITALPVMGIMISEFGLVRTKLGDLLMSISLINELTAVTTFAVLQRLFASGTSGGTIGELTAAGVALVSVGLFIVTLLTIHMLLRVLRDTRRWDPIREAFSRTWRSKQGNFALLMVMVVGSTLFSQYLGLTYVVGAFFAGLLINRETTGEEAHRSISNIFDAMTWGFFVPLFFAFVGVEMDLQTLDTVPWIAAFVALFVFAILAKYAVGYFCAHGLGWRLPDARAIGFMVGSRGAVELAMATILLQSGIINTQLFTLVAGVGLLTTIVAPIGALRAWLSDATSREELYNRLPALRQKEAPTVRHLRRPMTWEEMRALYSRESAWPLFPREKAGPLEAYPGTGQPGGGSAEPLPSSGRAQASGIPAADQPMPSASVLPPWPASPSSPPAPARPLPPWPETPAATSEPRPALPNRPRSPP